MLLGSAPAVPGTSTDSLVISDEYDDVKKIETKIQQLESTFNDLVRNARDIFQKLVKVSDLVYELTTLPAREKDEHKMFLKENLAKLRKSEDHKALFAELNLYWNYLSPQLFIHLVKVFAKRHKDLSRVNNELEIYQRNLSQFREQTPLKLFSEIETVDVETPDGFSKLLVKFEENISVDTTLQDVEEFRKKYAKHYGLRDFALILIAAVKVESFVISFFVPHYVVDMLRENLPMDICEEFCITKLEICGCCLFQAMISPTSEDSIAGETKLQLSSFDSVLGESENNIVFSHLFDHGEGATDTGGS